MLDEYGIGNWGSLGEKVQGECCIDQSIFRLQREVEARAIRLQSECPDGLQRPQLQFYLKLAVFP